MSDQSDRLETALAERYTIKRELGRGGMAVVYLAEDLKPPSADARFQSPGSNAQPTSSAWRARFHTNLDITPKVYQEPQQPLG